MAASSRSIPLQIGDLMLGPPDLEDAIDLQATLENDAKSEADRVVAFSSSFKKSQTS